MFGKIQITLLLTLLCQNELLQCSAVSRRLIMLLKYMKSCALTLLPTHHNVSHIFLFHNINILTSKLCAVRYWLWIAHESLKSLCYVSPAFRPSLHSCACMGWCGLLKIMVQETRYVSCFNVLFCLCKPCHLLITKSNKCWSPFKLIFNLVRDAWQLAPCHCVNMVAILQVGHMLG